jgi:hypothetical protein
MFKDMGHMLSVEILGYLLFFVIEVIIAALGGVLGF